MSRSKRELLASLKGVTEDIYKFAEACRFKPHKQQRWLFDAIMRGEQCIGVKSGQGPGKTAGSSLIALWRALRYPHGLVVYTAPSLRQVKDIAFAEIRSHVSRMEPWLRKYFHVDAMKVTIAGERDWGIQGVTATKDTNAQGYHREGLTVIVEESSGVGRDIIENFEGTLTNHDPLMIMIGNPNTRDCAFFDIFHGNKKDDWTTFTYNTEDTAKWNPEILNPARNEKMLKAYGRDSDVYRIRVLGEFPLTDPNTVIPAHLLEECTERKHMYKATRKINPVTGKCSKQFGIDFARFGGDENSVFRRSGNSIVDHWWKTKVEPGVAVDRAFAMQVEAEWRDKECVYVGDASGIGQGVLQRFYDADKQIHEFHNGGRAWDSKNYENKITEAWFQMAAKVKKGEGNCYIPYNRELLHQLSSRQYYTTKKGKLILESKDQFMKRGNDSPDRADGAIMCMYDNVQATARFASAQ